MMGEYQPDLNTRASLHLYFSSSPSSPSFPPPPLTPSLPVSLFPSISLPHCCPPSLRTDITALEFTNSRLSARIPHIDNPDVSGIWRCWRRCMRQRHGMLRRDVPVGRSPARAEASVSPRRGMQARSANGRRQKPSGPIRAGDGFNVLAFSLAGLGCFNRFHPSASHSSPLPSS